MLSALVRHILVLTVALLSSTVLVPKMSAPRHLYVKLSRLTPPKILFQRLGSIPHRIFLSTGRNAGEMPLPSTPEGGWEATSSADLPDLSGVPESKVYVNFVQYKVKPGKAEEFARGLEAVQYQFYRKQPGCISYVIGLDGTDENIVLGAAVWSTKEDFESLPKRPEDLEKLSAARAPYRDLLDGDFETCETKVTFGKCDNDEGFREDLGWDDVMKSAVTDDPSKVPRNDIFMLQGTMKTQPGKAEQVAKGLELVQAQFYRKQPGCIEYRVGLHASEPDTCVAFVLWSSEEDFSKCPTNPEDLEKLNKARAPFMMMLAGAPEQSMKNRFTKMVFGKLT